MRRNTNQGLNSLSLTFYDNRTHFSEQQKAQLYVGLFVEKSPNYKTLKIDIEVVKSRMSGLFAASNRWIIKLTLRKTLNEPHFIYRTRTTCTTL
jgi:hypothetical protein